MRLLEEYDSETKFPYYKDLKTRLYVGYDECCDVKCYYNIEGDYTKSYKYNKHYLYFL